MLDRAAIALLKPGLTRLARTLHRHGVTADQVTLIGFAVGLCALPFIATGQMLSAIACILISRLADGVDGALARMTHATDRGAFLDICLDFIFYASIPFAFALADPRANALAAAAMLLGFMGTAATFLAYATLAAKRGLTSTAYPAKSFYYLGGLTEATETLIVFLLCCLLPHWFAMIAWTFAALCAITTVARLAAGWNAFR
jgi:phosphatidylglycerophosphate synthase